MKIQYIFLITCILSANYSYAQEKIIAADYCSFWGDTLEEEIFAFVPDKEAKQAVANIVKYTGLSQNFIILASNVPNAIAYIKGDKRYIAYNQNFMLRLRNQTSTDWSAMSILAHEIGHHLSGHTIKSKGSNPGNELDADRFSGFVLYRMGATLEEAKAAMESFNDSTGSKYHPPKGARIAAITNGWIQAEELDGQKAIVDRSKGETEVSDKIKASEFVYECIFNGDDNIYFVDKKDRIIWFDNYGNPIVIGSKKKSATSNFLWMYHYQDYTYGVDGKGIIWNPTTYGAMFTVGKINDYAGRK